MKLEYGRAIFPAQVGWHWVSAGQVIDMGGESVPIQGTFLDLVLLPWGSEDHRMF
jgi:hypothetical protein